METASNKLDSLLGPNYIPLLLKKLIAVTKATNALPNSKDAKYDSFMIFYSTEAGYTQAVGACVKNTMSAIDRLQSKISTNPAALIDLEDEGDKYDLVIDHVDICLGRVDLCVDEIRGVTNNRLPPGSNMATSAVVLSNKSTKTKERVGLSSDIVKPQLKFNPPIDNSPCTPFIPVLTSKPFSLAPLPDYAAMLKMQQSAPEVTSDSSIQDHLRTLGLAGSPEFRASKMVFQNPYQEEITSINFKSDFHLKNVKEVIFRPVSETPLHWIASVFDLNTLANALNSTSEFAIDLEHHDFHTYQGLTCLMQISTRTADYIIDVIELRNHISEYLLPSFANPNIIKVLHGSERDIIWLQRDLGLYVVNMFDTGQAARMLEFPKFSLQYLLKFICDVDIDKKYQVADWRIRPVPSEMIEYARADTHYLLYIYDRFRNMLIEQSKSVGEITNNTPSLLLQTWQRSSQLALKTYEKEVVDEGTIRNYCSSNSLVFHESQMRIFRAVFLWRDKLARELDESTRSLLPARILVSIATTIPNTVGLLNQCCVPMPPLLRSKISDLLSVILSAIEETTTLPNVSSAPNLNKSATINDVNSAFRKAGWVANNTSLLTSNFDKSGFASAISSVGPIPINPSHVVYTPSDFDTLSDSQRRVLETFDSLGFARDSIIVDKVTMISAAIPSSIIFSDVIEDCYENDDVVKSVENNISSTSLFHLLCPINSDHNGSTSFADEYESKNLEWQNSDALSKYQNFDFSEPSGKKPRLNEPQNTVTQEDKVDIESKANHIDIQKFTTSIGWTKPELKSAANVSFASVDYSAAAKEAPFLQSAVSTEKFNPYVGKLGGQNKRVNKGPARDIGKAGQKSMTYVKK